MRSDAVRKGMQQAPHRSLFNALGMTEEEMIREIAEPILEQLKKIAKTTRKSSYATASTN